MFFLGQLCHVCGQRGATVGCCARLCEANFHMLCALQADCILQDDKRVFCREHSYCVQSKVNIVTL